MSIDDIKPTLWGWEIYHEGRFIKFDSLYMAVRFVCLANGLSEEKAADTASYYASGEEEEEDE